MGTARANARRTRIKNARKKNSILRGYSSGMKQNANVIANPHHRSVKDPWCGTPRHVLAPMCNPCFVQQTYTWAATGSSKLYQVEQTCSRNRSYNQLCPFVAPCGVPQRHLTASGPVHLILCKSCRQSSTKKWITP